MEAFFKLLRILPDYVRLAIRRETEYKAGFYTYLVHQTVTLLIWLIFWRAILNRIGNFGSWDFPLMILLTGFSTISMGLWMTFSTIWRLPREILRGDLNNYLIKPVHPFVHFIFRRLNLRSLPRIILGAGTITYGLYFYEIRWSGMSLFLAGTISVLSFLTAFLPFALICLTAFWIGRAEFLRDLFGELFVFQNYPISEFPNLFIYVFTFIFPLIFSATAPVLVLTKLTIGQSWAILALMVVIIVIQLLIFGFMWKRGLRRYESFGG